MRGVVIVAHPDDEVIWCGGLILQRPHWDWTVLSLCRGDDSDRGRRFHRVCEYMSVRGVICDLNDGSPLTTIDPSRDIGGRIRQHVCNRPWDLCLTHGADGEYGHRRHRQVHGEVLRLAAAGVLQCDALWTFAYLSDPASGCTEAGCDADVRIVLTDEQLARKKHIVEKLYGYGQTSFEATACVSPEGFRRREAPKAQ